MGNRRAAIVAALIWSAQPVLADCGADRVELRLPGGAMARFAVEVADDNAERQQGLMFRERMATSAGMLFVYETPRRASFWMKNTLIPLDMIFADATGTVTRVHANAVPGDTTPIDGGSDVKLVLEINGGLAARMGIVPGSVMRHPAVAADGAAWPCE
jgi:uncharacterized membrane protein (UPF0127 family)